MGYYPNPTTSPPPHGYPPVSSPPRQSFAQVGQVMHDPTMQQYPPSFPPHDQAPPHPTMHHSHSQPLYDPSYPPQDPNSNVPTYDHWPQGPPITTQQPAGGEMYMPDTRLTSPPPFLPHHSNSDYLYADGQAQPFYDPPTRGYSPFLPTPGAGAGMPGSYTPMNDDADQPLLQRIQSSGEARYGNPFSGGDAGDIGAAGVTDTGGPAVNGQDGHGRQVDPDEPLTTLRYGAAPQGRMIRRLKTTKRVPYVCPKPLYLPFFRKLIRDLTRTASSAVTSSSSVPSPRACSTCVPWSTGRNRNLR